MKDLWSAKSRLSPILHPGARAGLALYMMSRVIRVLREAGVGDVCVVSPDRIVLGEAEKRGAFPLAQESRGLNPALEEARRWAMEKGASSLLVLPADLPLLEPDDVRSLLEGAPEGRGVEISPDAAHFGTNALLLRPPDALPFLFGPGSFEAHLDAARERDLPVTVRENPRLAFDLDTVEDFARLNGEARP